MKKLIEKILFSVLLIALLWGLIYFFLPQRVEAKTKYGYRHPAWPLETCDPSYPSNCAVVIY